MFIPAYNTDVKVRQTGELWDRNNMPVASTEDAIGRPIIKSKGKTHLIKELVMAHHGEPPEKCRFPGQNEEVVCIDGDEKNVHIDNLEIREKTVKSASDLTDETKQKILNLVKDKVKYADIIDQFADEGISLSAPQITKIKKEALKVKKD